MSVIKNFLGYLKLDDEDYDDDYDNEYDEPAKEDRSTRKAEKQDYSEKRSNVSPKPTFVKPSPMEDKDTNSDTRRERMKTERTASNKIVPIRTTPKGLEVCIMKPSSFEESQDICDMLLTGRASVVNLEGFDPMDAQRIMDFISGCVYAINGKLHQISKYIFIFSPDSIDISGDYLEFMPDDGFEVPTLNKEF